MFVSTEISTNTRDSSSRVNSLSEIYVLCQESKVIPVECRLRAQPLRSVWNRVRTKITLFQCPLTLSGSIPAKQSLGIQLAHLETGKGLMNRFKGLDLVDRVPGELWTQVRDIVQEAMNKIIPKKKKHKKSKWLFEEALKIAEERSEAKSKGERER